MNAMLAGTNKKQGALVSTCVASSGFWDDFGATGVTPTGSYLVTIAGARGHIAYLAMNAKRLYQPFTLDAVTPTMREPALYLNAEPMPPRTVGNMIPIASPIETIVIKSKAQPDAVIRTSTLNLTPVEWKNLAGATFSGTSGEATFSIDDFKELPKGDLDVVLVTQAGERRCKIGSSDRAKLLQ
jgi:hypothetical protein